MLLGWIAGTMVVSDPGIAHLLPANDSLKYAFGIGGALLVLAIGKLLARRRPAAPPA